MIIDSHVHLRHGDAAATEYSAETIVGVMDAVGIDRSVVFAMSTTTERSITMAAAAVEAFPHRLIPYVYALPDYRSDVLARIEDAVRNRGFRGIKVHAGECALRPWTSDPLFEIAGALGVPCLVDFCGNVAAAGRIAQSFPDTLLIIAHMGRYLCTDAALVDAFIDLAIRFDNVRLDVSGVVLNWKIEDAARRVGANRLLFGTDGPHPTPDLESFARIELDRIRCLRLSDDAKAAILGENIAEILRL